MARAGFAHLGARAEIAKLEALLNIRRPRITKLDRGRREDRGGAEPGAAS
ncbi:MAG TPA: hypothetical protein VF976_02710 [Gemmatimonadales bacterium]